MKTIVREFPSLQLKKRLRLQKLFNSLKSDYIFLFIPTTGFESISNASILKLKNSLCFLFFQKFFLQNINFLRPICKSELLVACSTTFSDVANFLKKQSGFLGYFLFQKYFITLNTHYFICSVLNIQQGLPKNFMLVLEKFFLFLYYSFYKKFSLVIFLVYLNFQKINA